MSLNLFTNNEYNHTIETQGYVTIPFLNIHELEKLKAFYLENQSENKFDGFHATMFHKNFEYKKKIDDFIELTIKEAIKNIFNPSFYILYSNFMVKEIGEKSVMKWHQDWSYTDECKFNSYAIWIPLIDLDENNGIFKVAIKSHKLSNDVRGPGVEDSFISETWVENNFKVKPLYLKAGEAVIWNHKLLHGSEANTSNNLRIAATSIIVPRNADTLHFYRYGNEKFIRVYETNKDFYLHNDIQKLPKANLKKKIFYSFFPESNHQKTDIYSIKGVLKNMWI